jgi:hypothetical protein
VDLAAVRLGHEDAQWLYVVLNRAKHLTRIYTVTGPEERPPELQEVPDKRRAQDGYERLAAAMGRDRVEQLASDARRLVDLRAMPTRQLRVERDRLDDALSKAPRDRRHESGRAAKRHAKREQHVRELKAAGARGPELSMAIKLADQAGEQARQLRQHQQHRAAWTAVGHPVGVGDDKAARHWRTAALAGPKSPSSILLPATGAPTSPTQTATGSHSSTHPVPLDTSSLRSTHVRGHLPRFTCRTAAAEPPRPTVSTTRASRAGRLASPSMNSTRRNSKCVSGLAGAQAAYCIPGERRCPANFALTDQPACWADHQQLPREDRTGERRCIHVERPPTDRTTRGRAEPCGSG